MQKDATSHLGDLHLEGLRLGDEGILFDEAFLQAPAKLLHELRQLILLTLQVGLGSLTPGMRCDGKVRREYWQGGGGKGVGLPSGPGGRGGPRQWMRERG